MANLFTGITDWLSGGQLNDALDKLAHSSDLYKDINVPDLNTLIPQLKTMAVQGNLTPVTAAAVFQQMPGQMTPSTMNAIMAEVQGIMAPAQAQVVFNTMQGQMFAEQAEAFLYNVQGQMTPEQANVLRAVKQGNMEASKAFAFLQPDSLMQGVQSDAQSLQQMRQGLNQLQEIATNKGLTDADRAQLNAVMTQTNANAAGQREGQVNALRQQGLGGSGVELAARLSGAQGAANSNAMAGAEVAKAAQARALQALQANIQGNQQFNQQMFQQQADKARAQDAVNQFNAQARNTIGLANAQNQQQANLANFNMDNQMELENARAQNTANISNAANRQQANALNFQAMNQAAAQNAQALNQNAQFNAGQRQNAGLANFNMLNQIGMSNTAALNQANQFNAGLQQQANLANFNTANQFALQNAQQQNAAAQFNAAQRQQAGLAQYGATNAANLANAQFANQNNQFNAGAQNAANLANFNMQNQVGMYNNNIANQQLMLPYQAAQGNFNNSLNLANAQANAEYRAGDTLARYATQQAVNSQGMINQVLGNIDGIGQIVKLASGQLVKIVDGIKTLLSPSEVKTVTSTIGSIPGGYVGPDGTTFNNPSAYVPPGYDADGNWVGTEDTSDTSSWWEDVLDWFSDDRLKRDKKELDDKDIDKLMARLTGYKYRYKGDKDNPEQYGVMAQDLEKGGSDSVIDTPAGKMVQGPQAMSEALAMIARLHDRINKLEGK